MKKEIKFRRAHYDFNGKFMHFSYWGFLDSGVFASPSSNSHEDREKAIDEQFTGFLDKNGIEIYEGDVLEIVGNIHKIEKL